MALSKTNEIRQKEINAIGKICLNFNGFKKLDIVLQHRLVTSIESGILDASIDMARTRNIPVYWDSNSFIEQYSNVGYNVKINLDVDSSVNSNKDKKTRYYLISGICDYITKSYLIEKYKKNYEISLEQIRLKRSFNLLDFPKEIFNRIMGFIPTIHPRELGKMNPLELNPYINQVFIDELSIRGQQTVKIKYSKLYTCAECGNKKCQMRELQTRSFDEGGTLFITCLVCANEWRHY